MSSTSGWTDSAAHTSQNPARTQFDVPLYDVLTGQKIGRSTHDFICDGFFSCEDIDTYCLALHWGWPMG